MHHSAENSVLSSVENYAAIHLPIAPAGGLIAGAKVQYADGKLLLGEKCGDGTLRSRVYK